jgi:hypothetical protein
MRGAWGLEASVQVGTLVVIVAIAIAAAIAAAAQEELRAVSEMVDVQGAAAPKMVVVNVTRKCHTTHQI